MAIDRLELGPYEPERHQAAMAEVIPLQYPREKSGDFLNEAEIAVESLLKLSHRVDVLRAEAKVRRFNHLDTTETSDGGTISHFGLETQQGYAYSAMVGVPKEQTTDVPVIGTTAWFTSLRGHNEHTLRKIMQNGMPVIFMGAEGSYRINEPIKPRSTITLANAAAAVLNFSNEVSQNLKDHIHPTERVVIGESRGAMVGMGVLALDKNFESDVLFGDLTAPCFPREFKLTDSLELAKQWIKEPRELAMLVGRLAGKRLFHYPATIDPHPKALSHNFAIAPALFSGEAGGLAKLIDKNKPLHVTCFENDIASMKSAWDEIFEDNHNGRVTSLAGGHLTLASSETQSYILSRNQAFQDEYRKSGPANISGPAIFDNAHRYVNQYGR